ncbi:MAG: DUF4214 domain-containing protein [Pseudorhodoplanes sp.]|nr:DUF4214 domain-containing protein [Pseudorhodoplanes sp.]
MKYVEHQSPTTGLLPTSRWLQQASVEPESRPPHIAREHIWNLSIFNRAFVVGLLSISVAVMGTTTIRADLLWGVNGHPFNGYPGVSFERQLDYVKDLGTGSYRVNISDMRSAPELARLVKAAKSRGIEILPVITPGLDLANETSANLYAKSYNFAVTLVSRFKNDIRVWELGNELENYAIIKPCEMQDDGVQYNCSWGPAGGTGVLHYYSPRWSKVSAVLKGLSDGTSAVDPTIRKAIGTAGWGHTGAFLRMLQDGIRWDITVWHHYEGDPEEAFKFLVTLNRPIWVTEFNNAGGSEQGEQQQAAGLVQMMEHLRRHQYAYNVEAAHIYELMDEPYWAPSFEAVMGLVRLIKDGKGAWTPGPPKSAYHAVKDFIASGFARDEPSATSGTTASPKAQTLTPHPSPAARAPADCDLASFNRSAFSHENQVAYGYCLIMRRMPSPAEQWRYVTALKKTLAVPQMLVEMLSSDEVSGNYLPAALTNSEYVTRLYRLLLGREPDGSGFANYVSQLDRSLLSRNNLQQEFLHSNEFRFNHAILFPDQRQRDTQ